MKDIPTKKFTVRDILSINRTVLANERTFLAYLRTSVTFILAGISLVKFFTSVIAQAAGITFIIGAVIVSIYGIIKYDAMRKLIMPEKNVRHAKDASGDHDNGMVRVPKAMWDMVHRAYDRMTVHEK